MYTEVLTRVDTLVEAKPVLYPVQRFVASVLVANIKTARFTKAPAIVACFNTADEAVEGAKRIAAGVKLRKGQRTFWHVNDQGTMFGDFVANSHGETAPVSKV